ncbi:hypothetical protein AVEN_258753-1 [Araneus ventricosus]|uniref:Uncharacterized protein n=1 Tax=Araneus ventricosus TaxID=182803 RepID=A0A4Y2D0C4_ARAVE|nr:hypothetical protein AVEN_258753-1 [Araneus ventricosus]
MNHLEVQPTFFADMIWKDLACLSHNDEFNKHNDRYVALENSFRKHYGTFEDVLLMLVPARHLPYCTMCKGNFSPKIVVQSFQTCIVATRKINEPNDR